MSHVIRHTFELRVEVPVDPASTGWPPPTAHDVTRMVIKALRRLELDSEVTHLQAVTVEDSA
jgi:hypothetical protein